MSKSVVSIVKGTKADRLSMNKKRMPECTSLSAKSEVFQKGLKKVMNSCFLGTAPNLSRNGSKKRVRQHCIAKDVHQQNRFQPG